MTIEVSTMRNGSAEGPAKAESGSGRHARPTQDMDSGLALPVISPAEAASINAFYCRRPAVAFSIAGHRARITASWPPAAGDASGRCRLHITVDGASGTLILSSALVEALIAGLGPDQVLDGLDPQQRALLLELAVADGLSALEASLGSRISVDAVHAAADAAGDDAALAFSVAIDGLGSSAAELRLPARHAARFAQCLDRGAPASPPRPGQGMEGAFVALPVAVCLRVAATTCSVGEIATLQPGDVVMADHGRRQSRTAVAVLGDHLAAPVELTAAGVQITAPLVRIRGSLWEWSMENGADRPQADLMQKTDLDDIPVKLLFELGRVELSLAEIRKLAPGAIIAMPRPLDESVEVVANGRRIGRGSLVQIGTNLGVRITKLFQDA